MTKVVLVTIQGRVQGVGFRAWLESEARAHSVDGWVRNTEEGSVEALLSGPDHAVDALVDLCHTGPRGARVGRVTTAVAGWDGRKGFAILS